MFATRSATNSSSLRGIITKRVTAAAVRQRANGHRGHQHQQSCQSTLAASNLSVGNLRDNDDDTGKLNCAYHRPQTLEQQLRLHPALVAESSRRSYHTTRSVERGPALFLGLASASALAFAGSSAIKSYNEWKDSQPTKEELEQMRKQEEEEQAKMKAEQGNTEEQQQQTKQQEQKSDKGKAGDGKPRTNIFREWFDVGTKYYEGGFEDTMTKREAALVLGVRESSSPRRVKDAHRKLLILNHPDTGGSNYLAGKLNEAKELLLKGRSTRTK